MNIHMIPTTNIDDYTKFTFVKQVSIEKISTSIWRSISNTITSDDYKLYKYSGYELENIKKSLNNNNPRVKRWVNINFCLCDTMWKQSRVSRVTTPTGAR